MEKFKHKYRIQSARLRNWDYANDAAYFITICTKNRINYFGNIVHTHRDAMHLSEIGEIAKNEWLKTAEIRPDMNLFLDEFVVMPNHFHAIIIIGKNKYNTTINTAKNKFGPQSKNLASIIRGFKSAVTIYARKNNLEFDWQPRYYDHIIRNQIEFDRIKRYINHNPANWQQDRSYK